MRKIIVIEFITLDGVMQAPGGPEEDTSGGFEYGGWTVPYFDEALGKVMEEQMKPPFDLLLGRKTYDIFASYWPQHADDWPGVNEAKKYVVSHKEIKRGWENSVLLKDDVVAEIEKLKTQDGLPAAPGDTAQAGPDLNVWGSGNFAQILFKHDLVDELWLKIFPVVLGTGKRLFADGVIPAAFELTDFQTTPKGVIVASYKRAGEIETGSFA